jgi:CheY-like chemotaxis protein
MMAAHAAYSIEQLMTDLASHKGGRARFVEMRHVALLDKPVQASGEMVYSPPDRLEKRTLLPRPETLVLDKEVLSMERDKRKLTINLASQPEALAFIEAHPDDMDLLVTDYNMPGFSGLDVVRRVKLCRPDMPMVITSGHVTPGMLAEALTEGVAQVLSKQDSVEELANVLAQILEALPPRT